MVEHEPRKDDLNPYPWYDITCGTCCSIIATVEIVPDEKPVEPPKAIKGDRRPSGRMRLVHWWTRN